MQQVSILKRCIMAVAGLALMTGIAVGQPPNDIDAVKAANAAFYSALSARDAKAMEAVWANKPYVVNINPFDKTIPVGYEAAVSKNFPHLFTDVFSELNVKMASTAQIQTNGKMAWVVGTESATGKTKDGPFTLTVFATNVFEKIGNRWLMVSHHAAIQPK